MKYLSIFLIWGFIYFQTDRPLRFDYQDQATCEEARKDAIKAVSHRTLFPDPTVVVGRCLQVSR